MTDQAAPGAADVPSPCRRDCRYLPAAGICGGCGRTLAEIEAWPDADLQTRRTIVDRAAARRAARAAPAGPAGEDDPSGRA